MTSIGTDFKNMPTSTPGMRPRLLFLSQTLPYPPDGGVKIRTYHILRQLARDFDVTALCFYRWKAGAHESDVRHATTALSRLAKIESFPIPQEHSRARFLWDHVRSVASRRVYTVFAYDSRAFRERTQALLRDGTFHLVHADSLDLSGYFPLIKDVPLVCVHHDAQSVLLRRRAAHEVSRIRRAYTYRQAVLMEQEERRWCPRVALNVVVSTVDRDALRRIAPDANFTVVPNGVDIEAFQPARQEPSRGVVFVGGTSWFPNADGLRFFCESILPHLRARGVADPITWVGRATPEEQRLYRDRYGITLTGYVDNIRPFVETAACYIVPLRVGGGTRIKILDAWAMGKAIVTTSIGCEGLAAIDGENLLVRDTPQEFAEAVHNVLRDATLRSRLGRAGRAIAEAKYSWDAIGDKMLETYLSLLRPST